MTQPRMLTPSETRDEMVRGLKRRLVGPDTNSPEDILWPGPKVTFKVVDDAFSELSSYPYGPWVGPNGEEVLPQSPLFVYPVGTLGPKMPDEVLLEGAETESELLDEASDDERKDGVNPILDIDDVNPGDVDNDDDEVGEDGGHDTGASQQSIGISIRVPQTVTELRVKLAGGVYETIEVAQRPRAWWIRRDMDVHTTFGTGSPATMEFSVGDARVELGIEPRMQSDGSVICTLWARNAEQATNFTEAGRKTIFQVRMSVETEAILPYAPFRATVPSSLDLLYQKVDLFSVGHGCDTRLDAMNDGYRASTVSLPVVLQKGLTPDIKSRSGSPFAIGMRSLAAFDASTSSEIDGLIKEYDEWIAARRSEVPALDPSLQPVATRHLDECARFLSDVRDGWALVRTNPDVRRCFCDASRAMDTQRIAYLAPTRSSTFTESGNIDVLGVSPHSLDHEESTWRPFQIAFILSSLRKMVTPDHPSRGEVDVIWMPTGGGKTEAYLGLAAFTILWEKLIATRDGKKGLRNTKVFMRYTLRLLTVQQLTRAASLICALEITRRDQVDIYGTEEVRIGAWLGRSVTPITREAAVKAFKEAVTDGEDVPLTLRKCPWCGAEMGTTNKDFKKAVGYRITKVRDQNSVLPACPDSTCPFTEHTVPGKNGNVLNRGIPVYEIDEDVYMGRPDFVVGTIDKVARVGWRPDSRRLFGLTDNAKTGPRDVPPPSLFIQDELHLISGPLGSINGAFEVMLEHLCEVHGGRAPVIVAATATTKNFSDQVQGLYSRTSRVIPPAGISIEDSFFAVRDEASDGKIYVAVRASGRAGASKMQTLTLSALAHQAAVLEQVNADPDPYWSNVVFFSSRRALGMLTSAIETTYRSALNLMHALTGISTGPVDQDGKRKNTRRPGRIRELTATSSENVGQVLQDLSKRFDSGESIDLCFATSMVEVGLDVPRLGLMSVIGQPKSANQYIQVTGRVGRSSQSAGLIVTVLNPRVARDRAHHEDFAHWHERLYASVESTSLTPFTARALQRSLASVMFAMCRILGSGNDPQTRILSYWETALAVMHTRAMRHGPDAVAALSGTAAGLKSAVSDPDVKRMGWTSEDSGKATPFAYATGMAPVGITQHDPYWEILNSMRNVDQDANVRPLDVESPPSDGGTGSGPVSGLPDEPEGEL